MLCLLEAISNTIELTMHTSVYSVYTCSVLPYCRVIFLFFFQFYVFAFMGFGTFMPKYVEYQFRQKGSSSSTFAGGVGTVSKAIGLLVKITDIYIYRQSPVKSPDIKNVIVVTLT